MFLAQGPHQPAEFPHSAPHAPCTVRAFTVQVQDTCKKWSQGHLERQRLGIEGAWQLVHVEDVLAEATDVLAHIELRQATRPG
jgi:hypothetical protein